MSTPILDMVQAALANIWVQSQGRPTTIRLNPQDHAWLNAEVHRPDIKDRVAAMLDPEQPLPKPKGPAPVVRAICSAVTGDEVRLIDDPLIYRGWAFIGDMWATQIYSIGSTEGEHPE